MSRTGKWAFGMLIFAIAALTATWVFSAQHCINIDVKENLAKVEYSSPDSIGAIVIMLDFGDCVVKKVQWESSVSANELNFTHLDGSRLTVGCFGVFPALPSGQNVKLLKIHFDGGNCVPDTFTNAVGSGTVMVGTDAREVKVDINFSYTGASGDEDEFSMVPKEFSVGTYPNPFNPSMMIRYDVSEKSMVRIAVYNLLGQEFARLVDSEHVPGTYHISWNAQCASGTYFVKMSAPGFSETKKVVLLK